LIHPLRPAEKPRRGAWVRSSGDRQLYVARFDSSHEVEGPISLEIRRPARSRKAELGVLGESSSLIDFRGPDHKPHQVTRRFEVTSEITLRFDVAPKADQIPFLLRYWQEAPPAY
jgi:hypothetical protein